MFRSTSAYFVSSMCLLFSCPLVATIDAGVFSKVQATTGSCGDWLPNSFDTKAGPDVASSLLRFLKSETSEPAAVSFLKISQHDKGAEYLKWHGLDSGRLLFKYTVITPKSFSIEISHTSSETIWRATDLTRDNLQELEKNRRYRCSDTYKTPTIVAPPKKDSSQNVPVARVERVGNCLVDMNRKNLPVDEVISIDDSVRLLPFELEANEVGLLGKISVAARGDYCSVQVFLDRFIYMAQNAPIYSSGYASVSAEKALCNELYEKMLAKLDRKTKSLYIVANDQKQTFTNFNKSTSTMHALRLIEVCERDGP